MPERLLPVRPDLEQLRRQAKELLRAYRSGDPEAVSEFAGYHPSHAGAGEAKLADAQLVLARAHGAASWPRLVRCCEMAAAIWADDAEAVRRMVMAEPHLIHEDVLVRPEGKRSNWGAPMSYAANLGRDSIIAALHALGAKDHAHALGRAVLQGQIATARLLHDLAGRPPAPEDELGGPAYTLNVNGTAFVFEIGGRAVDDAGRRLAPVDVVLETDSRNPAAKHAILEIYVKHGLELPDTPVMALHRGRIDLLEQHLARDAGLLARRFSHAEIYPPDMGCHDEVLATHGTPLKGTTLLHMCMDYGEAEIARWLIARGAGVNARADTDADGFGGHTPLFNAVVSQVNFWTNRSGDDGAPLANLLLANGADPNARASLRKKVHPGYGPDTLREYRDVSVLGWGRQFHFRPLVSAAAMRLVEEAGGAV